MNQLLPTLGDKTNFINNNTEEEEYQVTMGNMATEGPHKKLIKNSTFELLNDEGMISSDNLLPNFRASDANSSF